MISGTLFSNLFEDETDLDAGGRNCDRDGRSELDAGKDGERSPRRSSVRGKSSPQTPQVQFSEDPARPSNSPPARWLGGGGGGASSGQFCCWRARSRGRARCAEVTEVDRILDGHDEQTSCQGR